MLQRLDVSLFLSTSPPAIPRLTRVGLSPGEVGVLAAPGGSGKTFFALQLAVGVACPQADTLGLCGDGDGGLVAFFPREESPGRLWQRLHALRPYIPPGYRDTVARRLLLLAVDGGRAFFDLARRSAVDRLAQECRGARLVILDPLSALHTLPEQDNTAMSWLVDRLSWLAGELGAAVLVVHHSAKGSTVSGTADAVRGASAIVNAARWVALLERPDTKSRRYIDRDVGPLSCEDAARYVRLQLVKANYEPGGAGDDLWWRRGVGGVLIPARVEEVQDEVRKKSGPG